MRHPRYQTKHFSPSLAFPPSDTRKQETSQSTSSGPAHDATMQRKIKEMGVRRETAGACIALRGFFFSCSSSIFLCQTVSRRRSEPGQVSPRFPVEHLRAPSCRGIWNTQFVVVYVSRPPSSSSSSLSMVFLLPPPFCVTMTAAANGGGAL